MDGLFFHPKLVHVPIALGMLMPIVAGFLWLAWWRRWLPARAWLIAVGLQAILLGSGLLSLHAGEAEAVKVGRIVAGRFIAAHAEAAEAFLWASGVVLAVMVLAGWLRARRPGLPLAAAAVVGTLIGAGLGYRTGRAGGELVYVHGAAQAHVPAGEGGCGPPDQLRRGH